MGKQEDCGNLGRQPAAVASPAAGPAPPMWTVCCCGGHLCNLDRTVLTWPCPGLDLPLPTWIAIAFLGDIYWFGVRSATGKSLGLSKPASLGIREL